MLELPWQCVSNEYPQPMLWSKNKKKIGITLQTPVLLIKVGFKGVFISQTCFPDGFASWDVTRYMVL